ncbi:TPA: nucleotide-binding protein [Vibrio parahaemolyticus]|uniref:TIR domain-containing protein n=1 Tax=Vibrio parahaemolyticus TaxID=670 RepID=UPI00186A34AD|nr:nucleotide-binding protein [Vibrio parahaemolyticus]EGR3416427.1 DNA-binding protein [Vibrio parahaemolyticus]EJG1866793.1 nucleotide-binding protein [Vibrio parahaemolyticus]ELB2255164.1 nucleotide-binding protein [Vibrio parahaemolyticus]MBE4053556.1 nucleotide-binding protein [Vibrio parahaemolyticus]HCE3678905.1 nucleotide-binding protein [Vibrio parahaemolyticus]
MNKIEELQLSVEALYHAVSQDKAFFSSIFTYVDKMYSELQNKSGSISAARLLMLASKIEKFFSEYRSDGDGLYIPPTQAWQNDDNVKAIFKLANEISQLDDDSFKKLLPQLEVKTVTSSKAKFDNQKVFIVHGRENETKIEVARFIEKLGFEAIVLHEQASGGKTIIEKIESYTDVGFAVVLYTPDDVGALAAEQQDLRNRARQNVVFEHGYLMAKIGRDRVAPLVKGNIELPNDISGVVYVSNENWQVDLAKELSSAGYNVDFNKLFK